MPRAELEIDGYEITVDYSYTPGTWPTRDHPGTPEEWEIDGVYFEGASIGGIIEALGLWNDDIIIERIKEQEG